MKAYCIFYGFKYSYNKVVDLQKEFNKCGVSLKCDYIKDFSVIKFNQILGTFLWGFKHG